ncbi:hypothetical protein [Streptomyces rimosus]|uniref:hypothetical protein n=1 Tax=Streptomyces rimosus TaxID=1927 RepID=UPI00311EC7C1
MAKTATLDDATMIGRTLARAFDDDPLMHWFLPGEAGCQERLGRSFTTLFTRQCAHNRVCEATQDAGAFFVSPVARDKSVPDVATLRELDGLLAGRGRMLRKTVGAVAEQAPQKTHWYLTVIGADPAGQR